MKRLRKRVLACMLLLLTACHQNEETVQTTTTPSDMATATTLDDREFDDPFGESTEYIIYYSHRRYEGLIPVRVNLLQSSTLEARIKQVVDLLTIQPEDPDAETLWPPSTHVREVYITDNNRAIIDFHGGFISKFAAGTGYEEMMVYSLVNTILTNFEQLESVYLLVDGATSETLLGSIDIESPLTFRDRILTIIPEDFDTDSQITVESLEPGDD